MSIQANSSDGTFSSWKFEIINALILDPRIPAGFKLIAIRILQGVNEASGKAYISDETVCDEVARTDRWKCNDARKLLEQLGWWKVERGHGGRASVYCFLDGNLKHFLDYRLVLREARVEKRKRQSREGRSIKQKPSSVVSAPHQQGGHLTTTREVVHSPRLATTVVNTPPKNAPRVVETPLRNVAERPPVHLSGTPEISGFSGKDVSGYGSPCAHAREEQEPPVEHPRGSDAKLQLLRIIGQGSWTRGLDVVKPAMGDARFEYWERLLAEEGFTKAQRAALLLEIEEAMQRGQKPLA